MCLVARHNTRAHTHSFFSLFDLDGGGTIDRFELAALVRGALEKTISEKGLDSLMRKLDADGSGAVEFEEFEAWWMDVTAGGKKKKKKGGFLSGFRRAKKFIDQRVLGRSGMHLAAKQVIISRMQREARDVRRAAFRTEFPPPMACDTCHKAFALYRDMARHKCSAVRLQERQQAMAAASGAGAGASTGAGAGAGAGGSGGISSRRSLRRGNSSRRGLALAPPPAPAPVYPVIANQDLDVHVQNAPEGCVCVCVCVCVVLVGISVLTLAWCCLVQCRRYEAHRAELVGDASFRAYANTKSSRRMSAHQRKKAVDAHYAAQAAKK